MADDGWGDEGSVNVGGDSRRSIGGGGSNDETRGGGDNSGCRKCGEDGHFAKECPNRAAGDNKCRNCKEVKVLQFIV